MLRVHDQPDLDSFPSGLWGIREPPRERDGEPRSNGRSPSTSLVSLLDVSAPSPRRRSAAGPHNRAGSVPAQGGTHESQRRRLISTPSGVAFDTSMARLGHGKGYYDFFITDYIAKTARSRPFLG